MVYKKFRGEHIKILFVSNTKNTFVKRMLSVLKGYEVHSISLKGKINLLSLFNPKLYKRSDVLWSEFLSYHTYIMYLMNKKYKKKFIVHIHGSETRYNGIFKSLMKRIVKSKITIIVPSIYIKDRVKEIFDVDAIVVRNPLPRYQELIDRKYSLLIASHTSNKKILESINKFIKEKQDPNHNLLIITPYGHKSYLKKIKKLILKLNDSRIELVNYYFNSLEEGIALFTLMNNCSEVMLYSEEEGMNVFLTEAKLLKKKILSSDIPPNLELNQLDIDEFSPGNVSLIIENIINNG